ncbi:MAG: hypothetical protein JWO53_47 [Chlamydiia bacterium]|nr:hypothetical protein [Chlamydiia bacterium]
MLPRTKLIVYAVVIFLAVIALDQWRKHSSDAESIEGKESAEKITALDQSEWKEFTPSNDKFKVMLPVLPHHASDTVPLTSGQGSVTYDMYLSQERDGTTCMISLIQYPNDFDTSKPGDMLDNVMNQLMAGNPSNRLRNVQKGLFHNVQALDFSIENNGVFVRSKTFLAGKTLFVLTLVDRNSSSIEEQFKTFSDSFEFGSALKAVMPVLTETPAQTPKPF